MRRGGLRAAMVALVLALAGCQGGVDPVSAPSSTGVSPTATVSPTPTVAPIDPLAVVEVCGLAMAATATTTTVFNDQTAAFEQAVARGDLDALEVSASAINDQFKSAAQAFTQLSQRPVGPALRTVLVDAAAALTQVSSLSSIVPTLDIRRKLVDIKLALDDVCAPATGSATPASD